MSRLGWINQPERTNTVLQGVGECEKTPLGCLDAIHLLNQTILVLTSVDCL